MEMQHGTTLKILIPCPLLHLLCQSCLQGLGIPWRENGLVAARHSHKTGGIQVACDGIAIDVVVLLDLEAVEKSHVQEIELSVGKQGSGAHAIANTVGEQGGIGLL